MCVLVHVQRSRTLMELANTQSRMNSEQKKIKFIAVILLVLLFVVVDSLSLYYAQVGQIRM